MSPKKRTLIRQRIHIGWVHQSIGLHLLVLLLPPDAALLARGKAMRVVKKGQIYSYTLPRRLRLRIRVPNRLEYWLPQRHLPTIKRFLRL